MLHPALRPRQSLATTQSKRQPGQSQLPAAPPTALAICSSSSPHRRCEAGEAGTSDEVQAPPVRQRDRRLRALPPRPPSRARRRARQGPGHQRREQLRQRQPRQLGHARGALRVARPAAAAAAPALRRLRVRLVPRHPPPARAPLLQHAAAAGVESSSSYHNWYNIFAFGDSFADVGNTPEGKYGKEQYISRAWYYPYGESSRDYNGRPRGKSTGRYSDYMVQSDFLANIIGLHEAPHAYNRAAFSLPRYGLTFATAGAGVFEVSANVTTLRKQVDTFEHLLKKGTISRSRLPDSVFLVAVSGNDYMPTIPLLDNSTSAAANEMAAKVTDEIVANVDRLRKLGAKKILVNNMPPLGCTPRRARYGNYTGCDEHGNVISSVHNSNLQQKLASDNTVRILDIHTAFTNIISGASDSDKFTQKLRPCCEPTDPKGYCGDIADYFEMSYTVDIANVNSYFYWDEMNPTHAGWKAVMKQLEGTIKDFINTN